MSPGEYDFAVLAGSYTGVATITPVVPGRYHLRAQGSGLFTDNTARAGYDVTLSLDGTVDETTGAADATLVSEGRTWQLLIPPVDVSQPKALAERVAGDLDRQNWADLSSLMLNPNGAMLLRSVMNATYPGLVHACRLGPGRYEAADIRPQYYDVLAITLRDQNNLSTETLAVIGLDRYLGGWYFDVAEPAGKSEGADPGVPQGPTPST